MHFDKDFYSLTQDDIQRLIEYAVSEDRYIEYKQQLPDSSDAEVKEFLADVSAFANAAGGTIIYGIAEEDGVPLSIEGIESDDIDQEKRRLEDIIRNGVEPKINQLFIRDLEVEDKKIILIHIPNSWSKPHVVNYKKRWKFYVRTSAGKHPMDLEEVRASMLQISDLPEKMRDFRDQRLETILGDTPPAPLRFDTYIVLHLIPYSSLYSSDFSNLDFKVITDNDYAIRPLYGSVNHSRYNLEGYLNYGNFDSEGKCAGYVQIFRNGIIESVDTSMVWPDSESEKFVPSTLLEQEVIQKTETYLNYQKQMGVIPPIAMFLSLLNVKEYYLAVNHRLDPFGGHKYLLQRQTLLFPELIFEDYPKNLATALRPMFDTLWNAFGWDRSHNYSDDGNWRPG